MPDTYRQGPPPDIAAYPFCGSASTDCTFQIASLDAPLEFFCFCRCCHSRGPSAPNIMLAVKGWQKRAPEQSCP